mgnify:CR=1 FL=1
MITNGDGGWGVGPRTAIGQRKDGTVLLLSLTAVSPGILSGRRCVTCRISCMKKGPSLQPTSMADPVRPCITMEKSSTNRRTSWVNA